MQFKPKTEAELAIENLFPPGEYDFEVITAVDTVSKEKPDGSGGRPMMKVELNVFNGGSTRRVTDYLLESMAFKLIHFSKSIGLSNDYETGTLDPAKCVGRAGRVILKIEEKGDYPAKNVVKDYAVKTAESDSIAPKVANAAPRAVVGPDEVPF